jgi:hypothetical protein
MEALRRMLFKGFNSLIIVLDTDGAVCWPKWLLLGVKHMI